MSIIEKIERIEHDFSKDNPPFDNVTFPEERLLQEMDEKGYRMDRERQLRLVSMFSTFDYNRNANQLVDNIIELWEERRWVFNPYEVPQHDLSSVLEEVGFRYPNRDAQSWAKNCNILKEKYGGMWAKLLIDVDGDAPSLIQQLEKDDFNCLKGAKIGPMYARIINDNIVPLSNVWELNIPVDTHIRQLSQDLFDDLEMDDNAIREEWRDLAAETDINRHIVDGALWHIGNKWQDWGEEYWKSIK